MMRNKQQGFTLIELMIVIAIIGILAAIAIPQYQDYVTRSKLTEGLNLAATAKTAIAETYQSMGHWPAAGNETTPNSYGLPEPTKTKGKYVRKILVKEGAGHAGGPQIQITYNEGNVGGDMTSSTNVLTMTPITKAGSIEWVCGNNTVDGVAGTDTTVLAKYLPSNCR
jgi:type IV pilus assembly protein PilA